MNKQSIYKKIVTFLLLLSLCMTLCACKDEKEVEPDPQDTLEKENEIEMPIEDESEKEDEAKKIIQDNYKKILQWIADNGSPDKEEKDVNNYGRINGYKYERFSFDVGSDEQISGYEELKYDDDEHVSYLDGVEYYTSHAVYFDVENYEVCYVWTYRTDKIKLGIWGKVLAIGSICVPFSDVVATGNNHLIQDFTDSTEFRTKYGYKDIRAQINADFEKRMSEISEFLETNVGIDLKDIGFVNYQK